GVMCETEDKVRWPISCCCVCTVAGSIEVELAKRDVSCGASQGQLAKLEARHDVVLAMGVADLLEGIDCAIVLKPVRTVIADIHTCSDSYSYVGNSRVASSGVIVESRNTELGSRILEAVDIPVVHKVRLQRVDSEMKVVDESGSDDVCIADREVTAVGR